MARPGLTTIRATKQFEIKLINPIKYLSHVFEPSYSLFILRELSTDPCCGMVDKVLRLRSECEIMVVPKRSTYGMNPEHAKELGRQLRARRDELGLSVRDL